MMVYRIRYKSWDQFLKALDNKEWELIEKITRCLIYAIKKQKKEIQIFEIETGKEECYDFIVKEKDYKEMLKNCLEEYIKKELYEQCSEIKKTIDGYEKIKL